MRDYGRCDPKPNFGSLFAGAKRLVKGLARRAAELGYRLELATPNGS
jgi:hypothetical protein